MVGVLSRQPSDGTVTPVQCDWADLMSDPKNKNREKYVRNDKTSHVENVKIDVTFVLHAHATFPLKLF